MKLKKTGLIFVSACLVGCSSYRPENFESKMARFDAKYKYNKVPQFMVPEFDQAARSPASVKVQEEGYEHSDFHEFNNKNIYFLSLHGQYEQLRKLISNEALAIKSCPFFHSGLLSYKEKATTQVGTEQIGATQIYENYLKNKADLTRNPEFLLPVELTEAMPTLASVLDSQLDKDKKIKAVERALNNHVTKTYNELMELCDTGSSDNYYVFENLVTYTKSQNINPNKDGLSILYRTTLFSNMILVRSLKGYAQTGRSPASNQEIASNINYEWDVMKRLRVQWMREFVANFK